MFTANIVYKTTTTTVANNKGTSIITLDDAESSLSSLDDLESDSTEQVASGFGWPHTLFLSSGGSVNTGLEPGVNMLFAPQKVWLFLR